MESGTFEAETQALSCQKFGDEVNKTGIGGSAMKVAEVKWIPRIWRRLKRQREDSVRSLIAGHFVLVTPLYFFAISFFFSIT
jgi:hypothetical protein